VVVQQRGYFQEKLSAVLTNHYGCSLETNCTPKPPTQTYAVSSKTVENNTKNKTITAPERETAVVTVEAVVKGGVAKEKVTDAKGEIKAVDQSPAVVKNPANAAGGIENKGAADKIQEQGKEGSAKTTPSTISAAPSYFNHLPQLPVMILL
jgi:hypothetical protein